MVGVDTVEPLPESLAGFDHLHRLVFSGQSKANCTLFWEKCFTRVGEGLGFQTIITRDGVDFTIKTY